MQSNLTINANRRNLMGHVRQGRAGVESPSILWRSKPRHTSNQVNAVFLLWPSAAWHLRVRRFLEIGLSTRCCSVTRLKVGRRVYSNSRGPRMLDILTGRMRPLCVYRPDSQIIELPFVSDRPSRSGPQNPYGRCFWDVTPTGDYRKDCNTGATYALEALEYGLATRSAHAITWALLSMPGYDKSSGVEVTFAETITFYAQVAADRGRV